MGPPGPISFVNDHPIKTMAVKVLVTLIGQQIVADVKQIENQDTKQIVGYWMKQPRTVNYQQDENGNLGVNFGPFCAISDEAEFSVRAEYIVSILEPREDVVNGWNNVVYPQPEQQGLETVTTEEIAAANTTEPPVAAAPTTEPLNDEQPSTDSPEDGTNVGLTD